MVERVVGSSCRSSCGSFVGGVRRWCCRWPVDMRDVAVGAVDGPVDESRWTFNRDVVDVGGHCRGVESVQRTTYLGLLI
jgi:hypothetical protein